MRMKLMFVLILSVFVFACTAGHESGTQIGKDQSVRTMAITGEIAKAEHSYIIRGKVPAEIFTILNPDPNILDEFVNSGKTVQIQVRIVSGDNIEIETIDGKSYH